MKLKNLGQAAFVIATAAAFMIGSVGSSEAAKKKKAEAAPAPVSMYCWGASKPVCATRGGLKFTYANACYATKDGAKVASQGACKAPKAGKKSMAKPAMKKPEAKKAAMKKPAMKKEMKKK